MRFNKKKILLIEDNYDFSKKIQHALKNSNYIVDIEIQPITKEFNNPIYDKLYKCQYSSIIINSSINGDIKSSPEFSGISLFKQLRFRDGVNQKTFVIILGYPLLSEIIRIDPANSIVLSEGCRYFRKPFQINQLLEKLEESKTVSSFESLQKYYQISKDRKISIEREIKHDLGNVLSPFLFLRGAHISNHISKDTYNNLHEKLKSRLLPLRKENPLMEEYFFLLGYNYKRKYIKKENSFNKLIEFKNLIHKKKILLIDDEHDKGWSFLLKELFYDGLEFEKDSYSLFLKKNNKKVFECIKHVGDPLDPEDFSYLKKHLGINNDPESNKNFIHYDLILLDLSLRKESGDVPIYNRGGYKVLSLLKQIDPSIPVLMFSATEKAQNLRGLEEWGILGLFSKEIPKYDDDYSKEYFQKFLSYLEEVNKKIYLREVWNNINILKKFFSSRNNNKPTDLLLNHSFYSLAVKHETKLLMVLQSEAYNDVVASMHSCMECELRIRYEQKVIASMNLLEPKTITCSQLINQMPEGKRRILAKKVNKIRNDLPTIHGNTSANLGIALFIFYAVCLIILENSIGTNQLRSKEIKKKIDIKNRMLL